MKQEWIDEAFEKMKTNKPDPIRIMSPQNWLRDLNDDELIEQIKNLRYEPRNSARYFKE